MSSNRNDGSRITDAAFSVEMDDLKRDVQSARVQAWLRKNQQSLTVAVVLFLLAITAASLWTEHLRSQKEAAANLYFQGLGQSEAAKKQAVFADVAKNYSGTAYALLARLQMAALADNPEADYRSIIDDEKIPQAFRWQARLDLAEYLINNGKAAEAKPLLEARTGKQYEQQRFYLLSRTVEGDAKAEYLRQSLAAESNDATLKEKIEAELGISKTPASE